MRGIPGSIRARITALAVVLVAVVLGLASLVLVTLHEQQLVDNLDRSLEQRADQIMAVVDAAAGDPFANSNAEDRVAQLLDGQGRVVAGTDNLGSEPAIATPDGETQTFRTVPELPLEDDAYRILIRPVETSAGEQVLIVGENIDELDDSVRTLSVLLAIVIPLVVLTLGAVVWWLVGRTLRPVEDIRRQVAATELDQLDERVPEPGTDDEIGRLASTMNAMLDRLDEAAARQRRFVADASHELRSPLTRIRSTLEVDLAATDHDLTDTCQQALRDAIDMQTLVEDLLFLAQHDNRSADGRFQSVDLDVVVDTEVQQVRAQNDVMVDQSSSSAAVVHGDPSQLSRLVRNLLDNAVRHASRRVAVSLTENGERARLLVDDDGPGIAEPDQERVFDRFTRLDDARASDTGGSGLGLAIAAEIVSGHGGHIEVGDAPMGGARFIVDLPGPPG